MEFKAPQVGKKFSVLQIRPDRHWGPPIFPFNRYRRSIEGLKRPGLKVNHSPPPNAKVKNEWSYTSCPTLRFNGVYKYNVTFLSTYWMVKYGVT